jgi:hypothetical protein
MCSGRAAITSKHLAHLAVGHHGEPQSLATSPDNNRLLTPLREFCVRALKEDKAFMTSPVASVV